MARDTGSPVWHDSDKF